MLMQMLESLCWSTVLSCALIISGNWCPEWFSWASRWSF